MANWDKINERGTVDDRRGAVTQMVGGVSLITVAVYFLVNYLTGTSFTESLGGLADVIGTENQDIQVQQGQPVDPAYVNFSSTVLGSANSFWSAEFNKYNKIYTEPKIVLFTEQTNSSCGVADTQMGPHYCPLDENIYLDTAFYQELAQEYGGDAGDVAQAYIMAHEIGHHVQNQLGILTNSKSQEKSIKTELQADCFAGLWAGSLKGRGILEPGEIQEAISAAKAVGDDNIQRRQSGYIDTNHWTHGSSRDRAAAFTRGFSGTSVKNCNY